MDINDLTLGQIKQLTGIVRDSSEPTLNAMIGKKVIVRTYSAGCWFGVLDQKSGNEVILTKARRMWRWWAAKSVSLSAVAVYGLKLDKSKIVEPVDSIWLEAIEIIPCTDIAIKSIEAAENVQAE